jgi:hypothetical protein
MQECKCFYQRGKKQSKHGTGGLTMANDYISRETTEKRLIEYFECSNISETYIRAVLYGVPPADVRPVTEISDAVDEVLDFLNDNFNKMPYHIYSALFDLVSGICHNSGADTTEVKDG